MVRGLTLGVFGWVDRAGTALAPVVRPTALARRAGRKAIGTRAGVVLDYRAGDCVRGWVNEGDGRLSRSRSA